MHIAFPVRLDRPVFEAGNPATPIHTINGTDDFDFVDPAGHPVQVGGHDSSPNNGGRGTRLTNLIGIHNGELYKVCPACDQTKRHSEYGDQGRTTGDFRDQSNCTECRGRYS
jgi:hypothetical protein